MADWTDLSDAAVGIGGIPSGTTVTALRDNVVAFAEQSTSAPTSNFAYDVQVFEASGTWTKPSDAVTSDYVAVWGVGGGGSGGYDTSLANGGGGAGGAGFLFRSIPIDLLPATVSVTVAAGGASQTSPDTAGVNGGNTAFASGVDNYDYTFNGGQGGDADASLSSAAATVSIQNGSNDAPFPGTMDGVGRTGSSARGSVWGGGGGGANRDGFNVYRPAMSAYGGNGGKGAETGVAQDGWFPGGGGGGSKTAASGAGADGLCVVMCFRNLYSD